uniref:Liver-expressed antimicrobial peptide 2 n=1 Tax=Oreochromis niloticus TaxID=8128 RepID=A0A669F8A3_ORENI
MYSSLISLSAASFTSISFGFKAFLFVYLSIPSVFQVCAGPLVSQDLSSFLQSADLRGSDVVHAPRRIARMTPLWRIMNSKPFGAYCQNNYECSTGLCRAGHCSTMNRSASQPVNY